jgi:hypothetical protein
VNQLCGLERRVARSGKDSIDHGPGGHDDLANSVAGCADLVSSQSAPLVFSQELLARVRAHGRWRAAHGNYPPAFSNN